LNYPLQGQTAVNSISGGLSQLSNKFPERSARGFAEVGAEELLQVIDA
jgi:hypothetical protein